jgi:hypothetical protein
MRAFRILDLELVAAWILDVLETKHSTASRLMSDLADTDGSIQSARPFQDRLAPLRIAYESAGTSTVPRRLVQKASWSDRVLR